MLYALLFLLLQLPACEWCGTSEAPAKLASTVSLAPASEPGERMVITGTIFRRDGKTPAKNALLYVYHTNAQGVYPKRGNETGNAQRHGYLRGWLRTDAQGRYRIESIRPGSYPGRRDPSHIHPTVKIDGHDEFWIDEFLFDDDPKLTPEARKGQDGIVKLVKRAGVWVGTRNIVLPH
ncbi:MAG TPA: intradiol ring-cleavage dioxygenase [Thermoanaerobaculia bacterium]|nr:intradiol ring-cleavage dioxygenase [Thermoanaerobaculia bacterium]